MSIFTGLGIAMVTPFGQNNLNATQKLLDYYGENADALIILGTTGEASTMTECEKTDFIKFVLNRTKLPVIVGAGSNSTYTACKNVQKYADLGVTASLIVTPYYNKCTQKGLIEHYQRICEVGLPIIAYNVPSRTGVNILPTTAKELADIKNLVGIKEASGNFTQMMETLRLTQGKIDLYSGDDDLALPAILMGYKGVISVSGNIVPQILKKAINFALQGDSVNAAKYRHLLAPIHQSLFCEVNPIPIKAALNMIDIDVGAPRLPLTEMTAENKQILAQNLKELNIL